MTPRAVLLLAAAVLGASTACSSTASHPTAALHGTAGNPPASVATTARSTSAVSSPPSNAESSCNLPDRGDIIVRQRVPNLPDSAQLLGSRDGSHCTYTMDTISSEYPNGDGYCTWAAYAKDNPDYNADATPAPPLKNVQVTFGGSCN